MRPAREHINAIVDNVVHDSQKSPAQCEKAHGREVLGLAIHLVGGDLQFQEMVIRQVAVECLDYPIPIGLRIDEARIFPIGIDVALGVGIPRDVQPVPAPPFAVVRRREQLIDKSTPALAFRGRETVQGEIGATNQSTFIRI